MVRFRKFFSIISISLVFVLCFSSSVFAYSFSSNSYYANFDTDLGEISIIFPDNDRYFIKLTDDDKPINYSNNNIYGYFNRSGESWRIRLYPFNSKGPEISQLVDGSYRYTRDIDFYRFIDTNIISLKDKKVPGLIPVNNILPFVFCLLLMIIIYYLKNR